MPFASRATRVIAANQYRSERWRNGLGWTHQIAGQARLDAGSHLPPLWAGDTALPYGAPGRVRYALDGGGALIAVEFTTPAPG